jgi:hypothetical protein
MDLHALARAGSLLHRAHTALAHLREPTAGAGETDHDENQNPAHDGRPREAHKLLRLARDHILAAHALAQLRIGTPQDRSACVRDGYEALADAADTLGVTSGGTPPDTIPATALGAACRDMSAAVILLAPLLSPRPVTGASPHTPVRLATHLQLTAETADTTLNWPDTSRPHAHSPWAIS